jgi:hypothetical protein
MNGLDRAAGLGHSRRVGVRTLFEMAQNARAGESRAGRQLDTKKK